MRYEIVLVGLTAFFVYNTYYDGKLTKLFVGYKKYIQIAGIIGTSILMYSTMCKNPLQYINTLHTANQYIKCLPVSKDATGLGLSSPVMQYVSGMVADTYAPGINVGGGGCESSQSNAGATSNNSKRSVSGIKKKVVAANQGWKCANCQSQLNAWFEVDHKHRLDQGGGNGVDNLVALCRECHGQKTTIESM